MLLENYSVDSRSLDVLSRVNEATRQEIDYYKDEEYLAIFTTGDEDEWTIQSCETIEEMTEHIHQVESEGDWRLEAIFSFGVPVKYNVKKLMVIEIL